MNRSMRKEQAMDRVEIHISYSCSNRCIFCSEHDQLKRLKGFCVPRRNISRILRQLSEKKFSHVTLTGGEPTLHPEFKGIVADAKKGGYKVYVSSNGVKFADEEFSRQTLPFIDEVCISLHGHTAALHNKHTRNRASFTGAISAMKNIRMISKNTTLFINTVITQYNIRYLGSIIALAGKYNDGKGQILLSHLAPEGAGLRRYKELSVSQKIFGKRLAALGEIAREYGFSLRIFGMPLCYCQGQYVYSNDIYWSARLTVELWRSNARVALKRTVSRQPTRNRIKMPRCSICPERNLCGGVFKQQYDLYTDKEKGIIRKNR